jgi:hypothetical protein
MNDKKKPKVKPKKKSKSKELSLTKAYDDPYLKMIFAELLKHLERGFEMTTFNLIASSSLFNYFKTRTDIFDPLQIEMAQQKGKHLFEKVAFSIMTGQSKGCSKLAMFFLKTKVGLRDGSESKELSQDEILSKIPQIVVLPVETRHTDHSVNSYERPPIIDVEPQT